MKKINIFFWLRLFNFSLFYKDLKLQLNVWFSFNKEIFSLEGKPNWTIISALLIISFSSFENFYS